MKRRRQRLNRRRGRAVPALSALLALGSGVLVLGGTSGAEVSAVGGGAFGAGVSVSFAGGTPTTSEPLPTVTLPSSGGSVAGSAPSLTVGEEDPAAPFGGKYLSTAALAVTSDGTTGPSGSSTSSASLAEVDALGTTLTATTASSTCTSSEAGSTGATKLADARLTVSGDEAGALPDEPAPNTTLKATHSSGEAFTVILNEHLVAPGSITVNAVHVILDGPSAHGDIVLGQSVCTSTAANTAPPTTSPPAPPTPPAAEPPPASSEPPPATSEPPPATSQAPEAQHREEPTLAAASVPSMRTTLADVSAVSGGAYGFYTKVSLFGGPPGTRGPEPTVELPATGSAQPITATKPSGEAKFGPATLFKSGAISITTQGKTGADGTVTSSATVKGLANRSDQPGPLLYDELRSSCSATEAGATGSTTISNGVLETKYDKNTEEPVETVPVPASPAPNTERTGTLDHVGDSYRMVFNEQIKNPDGSLTVNAAHMYLLGPNAVGDLIIGQSRCGLAAAGAGAPQSSPTASPGTAANTGTGTRSGGDPGTGATNGSAAEGSGARVAGRTATAAGAAAAQSAPGSTAGAPLASTGGIDRPLRLGLALVFIGLITTRSSRRRPKAVRPPHAGI